MPKLSDYAKKKIGQWTYKRRKMLEYADDLEFNALLFPGNIGFGGPLKWRKAADEVLAMIRHVRSGSKEPMPPIPWIKMIEADADMAEKFEIAEWNKAQR